ncbi:MAG: GGDEF domain-containing protein [Oleiphilaceae bacterium]|nr:GGDEF domain-containing protein [Oleiphilaceae bacterium]
MGSYHEQLQIHALNDLTNRAKSGIMTYLFVWLLIAFSYDLPEEHPTFFLINTVLLAVIFLARVTHYVAMRKLGDKNIGFFYQWLVISILASAAHWGGMTAWIVHDSALLEVQMLAMLILPAFGLGGACTLSISSEIRTLYPTLMFVPLLSVLIYQGGTENLLIAALMTFSMLYIFSSSRSSHNDYWEAITNHMVAEERAELMEKLSTTDPLTQLKNRMYFDNEYAREWKRSSRLKSPMSIIMVDLDHFKHINDSHGHMFGDECLRQVASAVSAEVMRPSDVVARYGGEEFVILLPNTDTTGAAIIADRILKAVSRINLKASGEPVTLTCSIGGATVIPNFRGDRADLIRRADSALYHAKNTGRNRYVADQLAASA